MGICQKGSDMSTIINGYYIETGYGFNPSTSTVVEIKSVDKFGRCIFGACVYRGEWDDCKEYARTHDNPMEGEAA